MPQLVLPLASPDPIALAIWDKVPAQSRNQHTGREMANYLKLLAGEAPHHPETLALVIRTMTSLQPKCFLTRCKSSQTVVPKVELIHSIGNYVVGPRTEGRLAWAFNCICRGIDGKPVAVHIPSTTRRSSPLHHEAQHGYPGPGNEPWAFHSSRGIGIDAQQYSRNTEVADMCMIPIMWAPYCIKGGMPNAMLGKIDLMVAASSVEHRSVFQFI
jgi:hypothetical protein